MVSLISDNNCCLFNNSHCGKPWMLSYSCIPGIIYSLHRDAKPKPNCAPGSQPASYWIFIKLTWRSNTPHRNKIFFQHHSVTRSIRCLAGWAWREGSLQPITSAPTSCGSETVLQVPWSVGMYLDSCRTWARGRKRAVFRQNVLIYNGTIFMLVVTTLFSVIGVKNWMILKECKK